MKAILYIGAVLMTGASVYGFVDYKKSNQKVNKLYESAPKEESRQQAEAVITGKKEEAEKPLSPSSPEAPAKVKKTGKPVAPEKPETEIARPDNTPVILEKPEEPSKKTETKENTNGKKIDEAKKKKKVNYKMFSRAALDERYLEKDSKVKDPVKTEKKKQ